jgi:hypothetical protein
MEPCAAARLVAPALAAMERPCVVVRPAPALAAAERLCAAVRLGPARAAMEWQCAAAGPGPPPAVREWADAAGRFGPALAARRSLDPAARSAGPKLLARPANERRAKNRAPAFRFVRSVGRARPAGQVQVVAPQQQHPALLPGPEVSYSCLRDGIGRRPCLSFTVSGVPLSCEPASTAVRRRAFASGLDILTRAHHISRRASTPSSRSPTERTVAMPSTNARRAKVISLSSWIIKRKCGESWLPRVHWA